MDIKDMTDEEKAMLAEHREVLTAALERSKKRNGVPIGVAAFFALIAIILGATTDVGTGGVSSAAVLLSLGGFFFWRFWQDRDALQRVSVDLDEGRKQLLTGAIRAKDLVHDPDRVRHAITVGEQRYFVSDEDFKRLKLNDRVQIHLGLKSRFLLKIDRLRKKQKPGGGEQGSGGGEKKSGEDE